MNGNHGTSKPTWQIRNFMEGTMCTKISPTCDEEGCSRSTVDGTSKCRKHLRMHVIRLLQSGAMKLEIYACEDNPHKAIGYLIPTTDPEGGQQ